MSTNNLKQLQSVFNTHEIDYVAENEISYLNNIVTCFEVNL